MAGPDRQRALDSGRRGYRDDRRRAWLTKTARTRGVEGQQEPMHPRLQLGRHGFRGHDPAAHGSDIALHWIDRAVAAIAPEKLVDRQVAGGGRDTIGGAGGLGDRIGKEDRFRVQKHVELGRLPERVDLGNISDIEGSRFQAEPVERGANQRDQRKVVVMRLVLVAGGPAIHRGLGGLSAGKQSEVHFKPKVGETSALIVVSFSSIGT